MITQIRRQTRSGQILVTTAVLLVVLALGAIAYAMFMMNSEDNDPTSRGEMHRVARDSFEVTIPASGELVSQRRIEIRNRLESRAVITEIVEEGKTVREGDVLIRLAEEEIRNRMRDAEDALRTAQSNLVAAETNLEIRKSTAQSENDRAELRVDLAKLALRAWEEGELISRRRQLKVDLETAERNLKRLTDKLNESERLLAEGFISRDEYERDEIAMIEAEARRDMSILNIEVFENYTYHQQRAQKESDVEQAVAELARTRKRFEAEIQQAESDVNNRQQQLESRLERLADLQRQLENCVIHAPSDGLVVYASSLETGRRGGPDDPPQVGTELRPNDLVMILPDVSQMLAAVKVNESLSGLIQRGQPATVIVDALSDVPLSGEVVSVGVLAETGGWRDPGRRDYTVRIRLNAAPELDLKPSMRCQAIISIDRVEDVIAVPLQGIFRDGGTQYVYVRNGSAFDQRPVRVGRTSELYAEIVEGVNEGEIVLLRAPRSHEVVNRMPRQQTEQPDIEMAHAQGPAEVQGGSRDAGAMATSSDSDRQRPSNEAGRRERAAEGMAGAAGNRTGPRQGRPGSSSGAATETGSASEAIAVADSDEEATEKDPAGQGDDTKTNSDPDKQNEAASADKAN